MKRAAIVAGLGLLAGCGDCRSRPGPDPARAAASSLAEGEAVASAVASAAGDGEGTPCARAHGEIARLGVALDAGAPLEEAPFLRRCEALPAEVQRCLRPSHAAAAPEACAALVEALPEAQRATARDLGRLR